MNKKYVFLGFVVLLFGFLIFNNNLNKKITKIDIGKTEKVNVGIEVGMLTAPILIAEHNGYFKEQGLEVNFKPFQAGKLALESMLLGDSVDIVTVGPVPITLKSFNRQDFSIFTTFVSSDSDDKIIARKDKGINTMTDLKGKKIGLTVGTSCQFFVDSILVFNGISTSDVQTVDLKPNDLSEALESGKVDAICAWEPRAFNIFKSLGNKALKFVNPGIFKETFNLVAMKNYIKNNPKIIEKFILAVDKGVSFLNTHKKESQNIIANKINLNLKTVEDLMNTFSYEVSLDQSMLLTLEDVARWAIKNNLTTKNKIPNFLDFIYFAGMDVVKSEAVNITH